MNHTCTVPRQRGRETTPLERAPGPRVPEDPESAVVEQAKGVLMLRYGVGSYEAFAVLVRWSREAGVVLQESARALMEGVCKGRVAAAHLDPWLVRWLEQRLRTEVNDLVPVGGSTHG